MILPEHAESHLLMRAFCKAPMLMLGNQENRCDFDFGVKYVTLDVDGGDLRIDLNYTENRLRAFYNTVYNLGTLEHVWNVHAAYSNVVKALKVGGYYLGHHPVAGYEEHGIHITNPDAILRFFEINGFKILKSWYTEQNGILCCKPFRHCGKNVILWLIAEKIENVQHIHSPMQGFIKGQVQPI